MSLQNILFPRRQKQKEQISHSELLDQFTSNNFFAHPWHFLDIFKRDKEARLMAILIDFGHKKMRDFPGVDSTGWFYCTADELEWRSRVDKRAQIPILERLVSMKVIFRELRGNPRRRYFKINTTHLAELMRQARRERIILGRQRIKLKQRKRRQREQQRREELASFTP